MENLGTAKVTTYQVEKEKDFNYIKNIFGKYIFNRISEDAKFFIRADKKQVEIISKIGVKLIKISEEK